MISPTIRAVFATLSLLLAGNAFAVEDPFTDNILHWATGFASFSGTGCQVRKDLDLFVPKPDTILYNKFELRHNNPQTMTCTVTVNFEGIPAGFQFRVKTWLTELSANIAASTYNLTLSLGEVCETRLCLHALGLKLTSVDRTVRRAQTM